MTEELSSTGGAGQHLTLSGVWGNVLLSGPVV